MNSPPKPDQALLQMPSFKAVRSFLAVAKYRSFTRAAEALCVTQAAISRQIRELELQLGAELFTRAGREIRLTTAGTTFFDAAQLSFLNIYQASERIRRESHDKRSLTLCCSPALAAVTLAHRLKDFFSANPDIDLSVITTQHFLAMEPGMQPDIFITKTLDMRPGYRSIALFHETVYPVCTPGYLAATPALQTPQGLRQCVLLDLNPYGRAQMSEQVDWNLWFALHGSEQEAPAVPSVHGFSSNDYGLLLQMVLDDQGVALGWEHLLRPLLEQGRLVRPVAEEIQLKQAVHYLIIREDKEQDPACQRLKDWLIGLLQ